MDLNLEKPRLAIMMLSLTLASCSNTPANSEKEDSDRQAHPVYQVFKATPQAVVLSTNYPAIIQGIENIDIRPKIDGYIEEIYIDEGDEVKKGQRLFKLFAPQYQLDLKTAKAAIITAGSEINNAKIALNRTKLLVDDGIISPYEFEIKRNDLDIKRAAMTQALSNQALARTNLAYTEVSSPVNGVVGGIPFRVGSLILSNSAQPLTTVSNIKSVFAYFSLNEKQLLEFSRTTKGTSLNEKVKNAPAVTLTLSDGTVFTEKGIIETVGGSINAATGAVSFRASFRNDNGLLRNGSSANINIPRSLSDAIVIPQKSAFEIQGKYFVYVVGKNDKLKRVEIGVLENAAGQFYVVSSGISPGNTIVYEGNSSIKDSLQIKPEIISKSRILSDLNSMPNNSTK